MWIGDEISLHERVCISSFVRSGFDVQLWAYQALSVPDGVVLRDGNEILNESIRFKYEQQSDAGNLACFADLFRYKLMALQHGWWIDTDNICLKSVEEFQRLANTNNKQAVAGFESSKFIACGVIIWDNKELDNLISKKLQEAGLNFSWGTIGPRLLTDAFKKLSMEAENQNTFYPIKYKDCYKMFLTEHRESCECRCKDSLSFHLWNQQLHRWHYPKNFMPPKGSFLYQKFLEICPELSDVPALPEKTFTTLKKAQSIEKYIEFGKKVKSLKLYEAYKILKKSK